MGVYYQDEAVTLYHADCREVLPDLAADVVLTDPPWVMSGREVKIHQGGVGADRRDNFTLKRGAVGEFDPEVISLLQQRASHDCLFLCGYKELAEVCRRCDPLRGVFGWQKPNAAPAAFYPARVDLSFVVWAGRHSHLYGRGQLWRSMVFVHNKPNAGCMATERITDPGTRRAAHPCQGPLSLYRELLSVFPAGITVLDAYAGTGTTLRAAKDLGLKAIGVEVEERYCEMIARRLGQGVFSWDD